MAEPKNLRVGKRLAAACALAFASALIGVAPAWGASGYVIQSSTGSIDPGTTLVAGSNCDDCVQPITFPFPVTVYGQSFTSASADSNGALEFGGAGSSIFAVGCPLPQPGYTLPTLLPYHSDLLNTAAGKGIFTSTTGSAPNRNFNVEWRADHFTPAFGSANFEVQFHEGSPIISFIYGAIADTGTNDSVGVQQSATGPVTQFACKQSGSLTSGLRLDLAPAETLAVQKSGLGSGTVSADHPPIDCGGTCSGDYAYSTIVNLTATPAPGSGFAGWTGCDGTLGSGCTVVMNADKGITASFDLPPLAFTSTASAIKAKKATLRGTVNGGSGATTYRFRYATNRKLRKSSLTPQGSTSPPSDQDQQVRQPVKKLKPGRRYYYRLEATNSAGSNNGAVFSFQTRGSK